MLDSHPRPRPGDPRRCTTRCHLPRRVRRRRHQKIEQPRHGDPIRTWGNQRDGVGLMWKSVSRNKRSITLDLRVPEGQELLRRLVEHADVVAVNTRPQTLRQWGLDYEALRAVNDRIVMLHITGYGLTGPEERTSRLRHTGGGDQRIRRHHRRGRRATDPAAVHARGWSGLSERRVRRDDGALPSRRSRCGRPAHRHQPHQPARPTAGADLLGYDQLGIVPTRAGNRWDISAPRNTYQTADGRWLAMSGSSPALALRVFKAIGRDDMVTDTDFSDPQRRLAKAPGGRPDRQAGSPPRRWPTR